MKVPRIAAVPEELAAEAPEGATQLLLTIVETAKIMGVSETTVKSMVLSGRWPSVKIGTRRLVVRLGLLRWIEAQSGVEA